MNPLHFYGLIAILLVLALSGCVYNNEEELYPQITPPTDTCGIMNVSYANDVVPILQSNCYVCHSQNNAPNAGAGIVLEGYTNVKVMADNGLLRGTINWESGFPRMPRGSLQLPECVRKTITSWIQDGSPNN